MSRDPSLIVLEDVDGAPVRIGQTVRVVGTTSEGSLNPRFLGRAGVVVALVFDDPRLQYPADPLIQIRVEGLGEDLFFPEELDLSSEWARRRISELRRAERRGVLERIAPPIH